MSRKYFDYWQRSQWKNSLAKAINTISAYCYTRYEPDPDERMISKATEIQAKRTAIRIEEIKRVWKAGMSAAAVADAINPAIWDFDPGRKRGPSRSAICGMFSRHAEALRPCHLPVAPDRKYNKLIHKPRPPKVLKMAEKLVQSMQFPNPPPTREKIADMIASQKPVGEASDRKRKQYEHEMRMLEREPFYQSLRAAERSKSSMHLRQEKVDDERSRHKKGRQKEEET